MIFLPILILLQPLTDCVDPMTQLEMNICSGREFVSVDKNLNRQWKKTAAHIKASDVFDKEQNGKGGSFQKLLAAQRAWLSFRDKHCDAVSYRYRGGSIRPLIHNSCKTTLTEQRTDQLKQMIEPN